MFLTSKLFVTMNKLFTTSSYGENIEKYILSHYPKDNNDIERLTVEYNRLQVRSWL